MKVELRATKAKDVFGQSLGVMIKRVERAAVYWALCMGWMAFFSVLSEPLIAQEETLRSSKGEWWQEELLSEMSQADLAEMGMDPQELSAEVLSEIAEVVANLPEQKPVQLAEEAMALVMGLVAYPMISSAMPPQFWVILAIAVVVAAETLAMSHRPPTHHLVLRRMLEDNTQPSGEGSGGPDWQKEVIRFFIEMGIFGGLFYAVSRDR